MKLSNTKDETLLVYYENIRQQLQADLQAGGRYRFIGEPAKRYANELRQEMDRRRLRFAPIDWR
jgi:hypothetical protein